MASRIPFYDKVYTQLVSRLTPFCDIVGGPRGPDYWARTTITAGLASFVIIFALTLLVTGSLPYAALTAPVVALLAGYTVTTRPQAAAQTKIDGIERALPMFLSHLVSTYADRKNMRDALIASTVVDYGPLTPELLRAMRLYEATADVDQAFWRLRNFKNRYVTRTFDIIAFAMETGVDIVTTLNMLTGDIQQNIEAKDDKNSRTGLSVWMVFASSALFYPLFAGVGFTIITVLETLLGAQLYTPKDKGLLLFTLVCYMFIAVLLDASYIGQVRYNSVKKGLVRFLPLMFGVGCAVLVISMWLLSTFIIGV